ncbi:DUF1315 domain-containing protein [Photobacterium kishitanii]|uniref:YeaC family protein n=1 Tax=Photobacterium kishitanii TaxID=318456 RepID=UPI0004338892|nr:DUF1315 family protein [Photobacterium kishitanii]KJG10404.1 hypothetical protein UB40_07580 [Photobacterium kishitanii]OBU24102.1 hypothetical protein AYY23_11880 [Photobacterium kishitanii]OBU26673.1 hypothetical protein AYY22_17760 [Photobacterium kishitanii]PSU92736.1 DUF1315 domain-containing protein [Photobacterium kishitanii]PSU95305.1 DUF1315 domain-containing protein [Photobacterium kishitanii]
MDISQLLTAMTPEVYQRILTAVETGKWLDGSVLTPQLRDSAMQAVMLYQSRHNINADHMTVAAGGEIKFKSKAELKRDFAVNSSATTCNADTAISDNDIARFEHDQL